MKNLKALLPSTELVLTKLSKLPLLHNFTLVGGSALAIYENHRQSEDLDFFTWHKTLPIEEILQEIETNLFENVKIIDLSPTQINLLLDEIQVTFFANGWNELQKREILLNNAHIAQIETLAIMKVNTLFLRAKFRDYYDLYTLNKTRFSLEQLYIMAIEKIPNLQKSLFQKALIFTNDIIDENIQYLNPKYKISLTEIANHFEKEIKLWNKPKKK